MTTRTLDSRPQPGLGDLERLLSQMRNAGLRVELRIEGSMRPLPPGVDLSAYRVVQEALTNALKHAGGAPARRHGALRRGRPGGRGDRRGGRATATAVTAATALSACASASALRRHVRRRATRTPAALQCTRYFRSKAPRDLASCIADDQALVRGGFRMILDARGGHARSSARPETARGASTLRARTSAGRRSDGRAHACARRHRGDAPYRRRRGLRRACSS